MTESTDITLVLFDIDGTLLDVHGAGREAFVLALQSVFGWKDNVEYIRFNGSTDLEVLRRVMTRHGMVPSRAEEMRFFKQLPIELEKTTAERRLTLHPGVRDLLEILAKYPRYMIGLVTGNVEECARIKLRKFQLDEHFLLGAFGHEHADRAQIAGLALHRARQKLPPGRQIGRRYLIGDTPADVAAAAAVGARSIAVTTGEHTREELEDAGADYIFDDLSDVDAILRILSDTA